MATNREQQVPFANGSTPADWQLPPILAGAKAAFEEHGYHGTTVRDIAQRAGVTVPGLYYHYESKQAMLIALLMGSMQGLLDRCHAALAKVPDDPRSRLAALVECVVEFIARHASQGLTAELRSLEPENRARYVALRDELEQLTRGIVLAGNESGVFHTEYPVETTRAVLTMCDAVGRWYRPGGRLSPNTVAKRYVRIALNTVGWRS
ncbi:MAG TPA: TetR/AcrR family transcriptional regulator [Pseudonocardiaceae bacterium]|jgi:AcrR family transcriptional regulator|nr:TetR/AcrR family transcriptional regulator [Pseudonocardiaceae bacterium]